MADTLTFSTSLKTRLNTACGPVPVDDKPGSLTLGEPLYTQDQWRQENIKKAVLRFIEHKETLARLAGGVPIKDNDLIIT